jgi:hypothetical protein
MESEPMNRSKATGKAFMAKLHEETEKQSVFFKRTVDGDPARVVKKADAMPRS